MKTLEKHIIFEMKIDEDGVPQGIPVSEEWIEIEVPDESSTNAGELISELKHLELTDEEKKELALLLLNSLKS